MTQLDDLTYSYFKQVDPHFQRKFSEKEEFRELSLPRGLGPLPPRGEFYPHQILIERYLNIWSSLLLDNEPGVGKTAAIYAAAISFNKGMRMSPEDAYLTGYCNWITKTYIIVPNETLERSWRSVYPRYSGESVLPPNIHLSRHETFYLDNKDLSIPELRTKFQNSFIAIDEFQELLNRSSTIKERYNWYLKLLHVVPNIKVALATGTVVIMHAHELGLTMNMLPGVPHMPTIQSEPAGSQSTKTSHSEPQDDPWWRTVTEKQLAHYLVGRVSHVKNVEERSVLVYPKDAVPISKLIKVDVPSDIQVYPVVMSKFQSDLYYKKYGEEDHTPDAFNVGSINAALSVIEGPKDQYLKKVERDRKYAKKVAAKLEKAADIIEEREGIVFVVSRYVEKSGNVLEAILKGRGYQEYAVGRGRGKKNFELPDTRAKRYVTIRSQKGYNAALLDLVGQRENRHGDYIKVVLTARVGALGVTVRNAQTYIVLDPDSHISGELQREKRVFRPGASDDLYYERLSKGMSPEEAVVKVFAYRLVAIPVKGKGKKKNETGLVEHPEDSIDLITYRNNIEKDIALHRLRIMSNRIAFDAQIHWQRNQCPEGSEKGRLVKKFGIDFESLDLHECDYGAYDQPATKVDRSTYDLLYSSRQVNWIIKDLISILAVEGSITVSDFLNRGNYGSEVSIYKLIYNSLYTSTFAPPLFSDSGIKVYLGAAQDTLFLQTDLNFSLGTRIPRLWPETYFYANLMVASKDPIEYFIAYESEPLKTAVELDGFLCDQDIPIEEKIETIEATIVKYYLEPNPSSDLIGKYEVIMGRYGGTEDYPGTAIFVFNKPTGRLLFVSGAERNDEVRKEMEITKIPDYHPPQDENIILHVFYSQFSEVGRGDYNQFKSHLEVQQVTLFDSKSAKFIRLKPIMAEFYVYSSMIREIIQPRWFEFDQRFSNEAADGKSIPDQNKIYGIVYDPQCQLKIYDKRPPTVKTKKGVINKAHVARGKNCKSFDLELLVDIALALGIEPDPKILDVSQLKFDKKALVAAQGIIKGKKKLDDIVTKNQVFYGVPRNYILLARWASLYIQRGVGGAPKDSEGETQDKERMCSMIFDRLKELGQIYTF